MKPLYREDVKHPKCGRPSCTHAHGPMFLHARCHIQAPVRCTLDGDIVFVRCSLCDNMVAPFRVELGDGPIALENTCHEGTPMDCAYEDGALHLSCQRCDTRVLTLTLAKRPT